MGLWHFYASLKSPRRLWDIISWIENGQTKIRSKVINSGLLLTYSCKMYKVQKKETQEK